MSFHFRPYPVLTVFSLAALALLIYLGNWQVQRATWKAGLIDAHNETVLRQKDSTIEDLSTGLHSLRLARILGGETPTPTIPANHARCDLDEDVRDGRTRSCIVDLKTGPIRVYGFAQNGAAGWRKFGVLKIPPADEGWRGAGEPPSETSYALVEQGLEPLVGSEPPAPDYLQITAPPERGAFASENAPEKNEWYWFDIPAIEDAIGLQIDLIDDFVFVAFDPDQLPAKLSRTPPAQHIGYAVTWYGMAIALIVLYGAFHARAGRLRFRK